jgi:hypothetical protein
LGYRINQRENYIKHIYHVGIEGKKPRPITSGEWEQLGGDASIRHLGGVISKNIGGATEARTYVTYTDAITTLNKTAKDRGLNWTLSAAPLEESLLTHGLDYSEAVAAGKMEATFLRDHGIDPELAAEQHFKNILPEVHNLVFNGVEKLEGAYKAQGAKLQTIMERYIGRTQTKAMARFATQKTTTRTPEQVLQQAARMGSKLAMESVRGRKLIKRQDELTKAFYWMTKLRSVGSLKEFEELAAEHPAALGIPDDLITGMREYVGTSYRNFTNTFRDQYDKVLLNYEGKSRTFFLPKPIADDARRLLETRPLPPEMRKALHYYDTATSLWKAGITTWVPAFFGRNGYNNVITSYVDAGISSQLRGPKAASILAGREGTIQSPTLGKLTHSQFRDALRFYGVLNEPDFALEVGGTARRTKILAHGPVRWGQQTNAYIENWAKVTLALAHVERGAGLKEAAWRVQQTLFDYDYLTSLEKSWFRRVMPFYTWFRKNIALYSRLLPTETGRIATIERFNATHKDRGPENGALGDYLSGAFKLRSEQHGKATYWYGIDLPHRAFLDNFYVGDKGFERTLKKNGSMITPVLQALEAVRFQEDPITGADLNVPKEVMAGWSEVIQSLPQFTQDYLEFHKRKDGTWEMNGTKAYLLFNTLGLNRFMWPVTQYGEAKKKDYDIDNTLLDIALGINAETFDISDTKKREVRARIRAAEERLIRAGNHRPYTVSTPARRSNP